ncbi:hypothetical protein BH09SUM1_BH09SUM1_02360 [soil metagenome]
MSKAVLESMTKMAMELSRPDQLELARRLREGLPEAEEGPKDWFDKAHGCLAGAIDDEYLELLDELRHGKISQLKQ